MSRSQLLDAHDKLTADLVHALLELGDTNAEVIRLRSAAWREHFGQAVTERREACKQASAGQDSEAAKLVGEVEALRAQLADVEVQLRYSNGDTA